MYTYSLTIPVGYTASNPVEQRVKVSAGILSRVMITDPPGCMSLAHVVILYQAHQIEPWNRDGDFHSDDYTFDFICHHEIIEPDTELTLRGWNDDTENPHTVDFVFDVVQPPSVTTEDLLQQLNTALVGP